MLFESLSSLLVLDAGWWVVAAGGGAHTELPSFGSAMMSLAGIVFLLLLNAFFVASEFAIIRVRPSQIDAVDREKKGSSRTRVARKVTDNVEAYLSANQLGITLASLALGFIGEPFIASLVGPVLVNVPGMESAFLWGGLGVVPESLTWLKALTFGISLAVFTFLHVVIGELIPKNVAIRRSLGTTMMLAGPLDLFYRLFLWAINFLNWTAELVLSKLMRITPQHGHGDVHTAEELALLVAESERSKHVTETEREILINALELNEIDVTAIMTPRRDVVALDVNVDFEQALSIARQSKHTRFPLVDGNLDNPLGLIHIKDVVELMAKAEPELRKIKRDLRAVPETMPLDELLQYFLSNQFHVALVVDEYGSSVGLVFLDDVLEELVGEIKDEFDDDEMEIQELSEGEYLVEGTMSLHDFDDHLGDMELETEEMSTVGGYITHQLGHVPQKGEQVEMDGWVATVTKGDGRRVVQAHFRRMEEGELIGEEKQSSGGGDEVGRE